MASAKKRRGRERKAAKKNNNGTVSTDGGVVGDGIDIDSLSPIAVLVEGVRMGLDSYTSHVIGSYASQEYDRQDIIRAGLLDVTLGYLGRCNEHFGSIMSDIGGDLVSPNKWLELLVTIANNSDHHSQIIDNIGPLVSCMCDDVERKLFGSKRYWHEAVLPFIAIIYNMLEFECNFIQLSQYKGLFEMIIQSWFWESNRPDIVNEFNTFISTSDFKVSIKTEGLENKDPSTTMTILGGLAIFHLIQWARQSDDAKKMLGDIGSVPIVSRAYDPYCKVSLVGGIIRRMKKSGVLRKYFQSLSSLIKYADCVDKDVITEMIDYGYNFTSQYEDADAITHLICSMITKKMEDGSQQPNDSRTAFAIRAGLLEYCTSMIARFGGDKNARDIMGNVSSILQIVYFLSFHKKTSKAIGAKRRHLISERERLKENQQVANERSNECNLALSIIQSIIAITSTNCFVCNKETERKDMKTCVACKSVCYCSEECQRKDWRKKHEMTCKTFIDGKDKLHSPLSSNERDTAKLKGLRKNIRMTQKRLFLEHANTIRLQMAAKQSPRSEYIVHFDLCQRPLVVTVIHERKALEEKSISDENIMCVYQSPFFSNSNELGPGRSLSVCNLFPREWLSDA